MIRQPPGRGARVKQDAATGFRAPPAATPPDVTHLLEPSAYRENWPGRPKAAHAVGILRISAQQFIDARKPATQNAIAKVGRPYLEAPEDLWEEAYNDGLMAALVAAGTCHPLDRDKSWIDVPEMNIARALTADGLRALWDAIAQHRKRGDPTVQPATSDELAELVERLGRGQLDVLERGLQMGIRREMTTMLATLRLANGPLVKG